MTSFTATTASVVVSGTAEALASVTLFKDGANLATTNATAAGTWTYGVSLPNGTYTFTATATDTAGNVSPVSAPGTITVQITPTGGGGSGGGGGGGIVVPVTAQISLGNLNQVYDGTAKRVSVTTVPATLDVTVTYNGSAAAPSAVGSYAVVATVTATGYQGTATGTLVIAAASQSIAFNSPASAAVGTTTTLAVTASSGLPVTLTLVSGPATLAGNRLTPTGTGVAIIRASQPGDSSYLAAPSVERIIALTAATQQIFVGQVTTGTTRAGEVAAVFPPNEPRGSLLLAVPAAGLALALDLTLAADGSFETTFTADAATTTSVRALTGPRRHGHVARHPA